MTESSIVMLPISALHPHPHNPRTNLGELDELTASIKANGIMQNLTAVEDGDGGYTVVIGHRRLAAAKKAGLDEVPCAVVEMDEGQQMATMLLENMQRSDLTVYEQAQGMQLLLDMSFSVKDIAEKTGFSESTVRRRAALVANFNKATFEATKGRQVSLADYEKLYVIDDDEKRDALLKKIGTADFNNDYQKELRDQKFEQNKKAITELLNEHSVVWLRETETGYNRGYTLEGCYYFENDTPKLKLKEGKEYAAKLTHVGLFLYVKSDSDGEKNKKDQEQMKKREEDFSKGKEFYCEAEEINNRMTALRKDYIDQFTISGRKPGRTEKEELIFRNLLQSLCESKFYLDGVIQYDKGEIVNFDKAYDSDGGIRIMLHMLEKQMGGSYIATYDRNEAVKKPKYVTKLNRWYYLLTQLGYEMSTEEKQLRDGTHEIYTKYKD